MAIGFLKLPERLQGRVKAELKPEETVAWAGQPLPDRYARAKAGLIWLFFIPWTASAIFWLHGASSQLNASDADQLQRVLSIFPGFVFVAIGLVGLTSPLWLRREALHVVYVVTDRRAFSIEGRWRIRVRSFLPKQLYLMRPRPHADGTGNLILGFGRRVTFGFFGLPDVWLVQRLLEDLRARGGG